VEVDNPVTAGAVYRLSSSTISILRRRSRRRTTTDRLFVMPITATLLPFGYLVRHGMQALPQANHSHEAY
jgi:hypothetical protein